MTNWQDFLNNHSIQSVYQLELQRRLVMEIFNNPECQEALRELTHGSAPARLVHAISATHDDLDLETMYHEAAKLSSIRNGVYKGKRFENAFNEWQEKAQSNYTAAQIEDCRRYFYCQEMAQDLLNISIYDARHPSQADMDDQIKSVLNLKRAVAAVWGGNTEKANDQINTFLARIEPLMAAQNWRILEQQLSDALARKVAKDCVLKAQSGNGTLAQELKNIKEGDSAFGYIVDSIAGRILNKKTPPPSVEQAASGITPEILSAFDVMLQRGGPSTQAAHVAL